jgi:hypothetical protein
MPLPTSGPISFSQLRAEMNSGNSGAISLSLLYANGSLGARGVTGIPLSGAISLSAFRGKTGNPVPSGLLAKYSGDSWNGATLVDETGGGYNSTASKGTITATTEANTTLKLIYGNTAAGIQFPTTILPSTYTMFVISRYNGSNRNRIIDGIGNNWLSGHWNGQTCVAYHEGWVAGSNSPNAVGTGWVLSTDQINLYRANKTSYGTSGGTQSTRLSIHYGSYTGISYNELSDWAVYAVLVYNRALSAAEYQAVENYLASIYHIQLVTTTNWYTLFTRTNAAFTMVQTGSDPNVQLQMSSSSVNSSNNALYYSNRLQDYTQLTIDFDIYVANAGADGASFNIGCTSSSFFGEGPNTPGFCIAFQIYTGGGKSAGIYLYNDAGTQVGFYAISLNNSTWTPVRILYNRSPTTTWQINYNGSSVITYGNANNEAWVTSTSGSYCGFASRTGGANMDFYVRRLSITT